MHGKTVPRHCVLKCGGNELDAVFMGQDTRDYSANSTSSIQHRLKGKFLSIFPPLIKYRPFNAMRAILFNSQEIALA